MRSTSPDHPLRHAPFRWLVTGTTINLLGSGIATVALAFAVLDLGGGRHRPRDRRSASTRSPTSAPILFGGVLGDRLPRNVMLQGTAASAAVVQGLVAALADRRLVEHPAARGPGHAQRRPERPGRAELVGDHPADRPRSPAAAGDLLAPDQPEHRPDRRQRRRRSAGGRGGQRLGAGFRRAHVRGRGLVLHAGGGAPAGRARGPRGTLAGRGRRVPRGAAAHLAVAADPPGAALPPLLRRRAERAGPDRGQRLAGPAGVGLGARRR